MKYKTGDRVEIINYGHPGWWRIDGKVHVSDLRPELVGCKATVIGGVTTQKKQSYKLDIDGHGHIAWFGLKQLKLIE